MGTNFSLANSAWLNPTFAPLAPSAAAWSELAGGAAGACGAACGPISSSLGRYGTSSGTRNTHLQCAKALAVTLGYEVQVLHASVDGDQAATV